MNTATNLKLPKWPFFLGDALIVGFAWLAYLHIHAAIGHWEEILFLLCGLTGGLLAVAPFWLEYKTATKMVETGALLSALEQMKNARELSEKIGAATGEWQTTHDAAGKTALLARELYERMAGETAAFTQFLQKANDSEKSHYKLEIEKLRRTETEWLQVLVRILDHTFALHQGAVRSANANVIEQLTQFQNSCRDVARRMGLVPFAPKAGDPFDAKIHQSSDAQIMALTDSKVRETVATGYMYQGQMIRPALVTLQTQTTAVSEVTKAKEVIEETPDADGGKEPTLF